MIDEIYYYISSRLILCLIKPPSFLSYFLMPIRLVCLHINSLSLSPFFRSIPSPSMHIYLLPLQINNLLHLFFLLINKYYPPLSLCLFYSYLPFFPNVYPLTLLSFLSLFCGSTLLPPFILQLPLHINRTFSLLFSPSYHYTYTPREFFPSILFLPDVSSLKCILQHLSFLYVSFLPSFFSAFYLSSSSASSLPIHLYITG